MKILLKSLGTASLILFFILVGLAGLSNTTSAQSELLFGQNHYYSVLFRGNGEAITYAKIVITNPGEKPLTDFSFEMPGVSPSEFIAFQQKLPQQCAKYPNYDSTKPCLEYRDPTYTGYYYYGDGNGRAEYKKVQYTKSGNTYHLTLPTAVEPFKSTAVIISYAAMGYVRESVGLYKFDFETLKVPSRVTDVRVAVNVDTDFQLKGARSEVNYNMGMEAAKVSSTDSSVTSPELDKVVSQIGSYGAIVKNAKNLSPNESFSVRGEYAKSWSRLYLGSLLVALFIIGCVLAALYFVTKFQREKKGKGPDSGAAVSTADVGGNAVNPVVVVKSAAHPFNLFTTSYVSLLSVVLVVGLTYFLMFLGKTNLLDSMGYDPTFTIISIIAIVLLYILIILGPAIMFASHNGWRSFLYILIGEFIWFIVFMIIYFILFKGGTMPMYRGAMMY